MSQVTTFTASVLDVADGRDVAAGPGIRSFVHDSGHGGRESSTASTAAGGRRKERLNACAAEVFAAFADHVLPFDAAAAMEYVGIVSDRERATRRWTVPC